MRINEWNGECIKKCYLIMAHIRIIENEMVNAWKILSEYIMA